PAQKQGRQRQAVHQRRVRKIARAANRTRLQSRAQRFQTGPDGSTLFRQGIAEGSTRRRLCDAHQGCARSAEEAGRKEEVKPCRRKSKRSRSRMKIRIRNRIKSKIEIRIKTCCLHGPSCS